MLTELSAAVIAAILVGLTPAGAALAATESHITVESADLVQQPASPARIPDAVSDTVAAVSNADWNATFEAWKSQHPEAECQGPDDAPTELLCHVCRVQAASGSSTEWSFYSLGNEDPSQCRLYQGRALFVSTPEDLGGLQGLATVEHALAAGFGFPAVAPNGCESNEEGCWTILELVVWEHPNLEILAYRSDGPLGTVVVVRSAPLKAARRLSEDGAWGMQSPGLHERILDLIVADLGDHAAHFQDALRAGSGTEKLLAELRALLDDARKVEGPNRYALLLAADMLAGTLSLDSTKVPTGLPKGLDFGEDPEGESRSYRHNLLQEVLRDAPEASNAHDLAFLIMLDRGFDPSDTCEAGEDQFHGVAREATAYLSKRPDSKYRADVSYLLAQAYEIWWSEGQKYDDKAREGAETARRRAVELYQQIVRAEPTSDRAHYAKLVLPWLMLRVPTDQRRFLCDYGC